MYLTEPKLIDVVKKQFLFKLKAYPSIFGSLLLVQAFALVLSFGSNSGGSMSSNETLFIIQSTYTNDIPFVFTLFWAFLTATLITTTAYRNDAFAFITTRTSHHLSSILILLFASFIGGLTAVLTGPLITLITYLRKGSLLVEPLDLSTILLHVVTAFAYTVLFASIGYLLGSFIQLSRWFVPIIIVMLVILPYLLLAVSIVPSLEQVIGFFGAETSLSFFLLKVAVTSIILFFISIVSTMKTEVRK